MVVDLVVVWMLGCSELLPPAPTERIVDEIFEVVAHGTVSIDKRSTRAEWQLLLRVNPLSV